MRRSIALSTFVILSTFAGSLGEHHAPGTASTVSLNENTNQGSPTEELGQGAQSAPPAGSTSQASSEVVVKVSLLVGATSERRFDAEMQTAFKAALVALCQVKAADIQMFAKVVPKKSGRRLQQSEKTTDDQVQVDVTVQVKDRMSANVVSGALKQGVVGGEKSDLSQKFSEECQKIPTIDTKFAPIVTLKEDPIVIGGEPVIVAPPERARPKWCKDYGKTKSKGDAMTWTKQQCAHNWGTYEDILDNVEGVICMCDGLKISILPQDPKAPDLQTVALIRAAASSNNKTYSIYAMKIQSGVSLTRSTPEIGLTVEMEFEQTAKKGRRKSFLSFNSIFEYNATEGTSLQDRTTKQWDYETMTQAPGVQCNGTQPANDKPGLNCEVQSFYLDKFHPAVLIQDGKSQTIHFTSDLQGGSPWCQKENGGLGCAAVQLKPVVTFGFGFNQDDFLNTQLSVNVDNFPYKASTTTLAMHGKLYTNELTATIAEKDQKLNTGNVPDGDCSLGLNSVLPADCPRLVMDGGFQFSWPRVVTDINSDATHQVSASDPQPTSRSSSTILPANLNSTEALAQTQSTFFSFKHNRATGLKWVPSITATNLPQVPHNLSILWSPSVWLLLGLHIVVIHLY